MNGKDLRDELKEKWDNFLLTPYNQMNQIPKRRNPPELILK